MRHALLMTASRVMEPTGRGMACRRIRSWMDVEAELKAA